MTAPPSRDLVGEPGPAEALAAPPADVQQMLEQHHAALPFYFDAQRAAAAQRSRSAWPHIWRMAPPP